MHASEMSLHPMGSRWVKPASIPAPTLTHNDRLVLGSIAATFLGSCIYAVLFGGLFLTLTLGLIFLGAALAIATTSHGQFFSQIGLPILGMAMVALLIHSARGRTEAHFAVFAFLACLVVYRSAIPIVVGAAAIAVHHLSFNFFQQWGWGPLCFSQPSLLIVVEHAAYVIVEAAVLIVLAMRSQADFNDGAELARIVDGLVQADGSINLHLARARSNLPATGKLLSFLDQVKLALSQVLELSNSVSTASTEIALGSHDLSNRTEQTASNLQSTASSMEQLSLLVNQSAESASVATQLAGNAAQVAEHSGVAIDNVVSTMTAIQTSSKQISDIIGVIDSIAFQTNILALNAAVEAARAGEQGRGFAVVASEVRNLASRSAQAAKEIKGLINHSVENVEIGAKQVSEAGGTMKELVASVRKVTDIISQISDATHIQSTSLSDVNHAVSGLEQMTQQNAALVEESAAASSSLSEQATQLRAALSKFRTDGV